MRSSSFGLVGVVAIASLAACSVSSTANSITFKTQKQFTDSTQAPKSASWNGEAISITQDGVQNAIGDSGLEFVVDSSATQVTVAAVFAAKADDDAHESDAQASIKDAIATFNVGGGNGSPITIECHHGSAHGTSNSAQSGCLKLTVTIPAGTAAKPLDLTAGCGNGDTKFDGPVTAKSLHLQSNGAGSADVKVTPTKGGTIDLETGGAATDFTVELPSDFAADSVTLTSESSEPDAVTTSDFPNMKSGSGFGTSGTGAASLKVVSGLGKIVVKKQ